MSKLSLPLAVFVGPAAFVTGGAGQPPEPLPNEAVDAEFPAHWTKYIIAAYDDFSKVRTDLSCFDVRVRKKGGLFNVSIMPPLNVVTNGDRITFPVVPGDSRCGRGIGYDFDVSGKMVRRSIAR